MLAFFDCWQTRMTALRCGHFPLALHGCQRPTRLSSAAVVIDDDGGALEPWRMAMPVCQHPMRLYEPWRMATALCTQRALPS